MGFLSYLLLGDKRKKLKLKQLLFFGLILSAVIGPGISYSSLYLFHLLLLINAIYLFFACREDFLSQIKDLFSFKNKMNYFIFFSLFYFAIWIPFAESTYFAVRHFIFMLVGFSLTLFITSQIKNLRNFEFMFRSIVFAYFLDMLVAVLEVFQLLRWPISKLSYYNHLFGRENHIETILKETQSKDYVHSMPASFHWNPNNFATFALLGLPFLLLCKNFFKSFLGICLIMLLIVASGSKSAFLGAIIIFIFSLFFIKKYLKNILAFLFLLVCLSTNVFGLLQNTSMKLDEVQMFIYSGLGIEIPIEMDQDLNKSSTGYRMQLIEKGLGIFQENPLLGVGGGNSQYLIEKSGGVGEKNITNLHNFWLEIMVEGGIFYLLLFVIWISIIMTHYVRNIKSREVPEQIKYWSASILLTVFGFLISGIGPSSLIAYLPLYLFLGVVLSFYYITTNSNYKP